MSSSVFESFNSFPRPLLLLFVCLHFILPFAFVSSPLLSSLLLTEKTVFRFNKQCCALLRLVLKGRSYSEFVLGRHRHRADIIRSTLLFQFRQKQKGKQKAHVEGLDM